MKNPSRKSLPSIAMPILVAAVRLDLFVKMLFMRRRKKIRYLSRTIFQANGRLRHH
ncbi:MAG: hypothetical protein Q8927_00580 [Bacteroidota bacterium]|nr:hypothetical protein [Bacteroidota bacterium]